MRKSCKYRKNCAGKLSFKVMLKKYHLIVIQQFVLKNYSTKNWLKKVMRKSYKYRTNCAKKLSFKIILKKYHLNSYLEKL